MKVYKAEDRDGLYTKIFIYKQRRRKMGEKYGFRNPIYKENVKLINKGIHKYRQAIEAIDKRNNKLLAINNALATFSGVNVKGSAKSVDERVKLYRNIFYKYTLEHGIPSILVAEFTGAFNRTPARSRIKFIKSFSSSPEVKDVYRRFKIYIKEIEAASFDSLTNKKMDLANGSLSGEVAS